MDKADKAKLKRRFEKINTIRGDVDDLMWELSEALDDITEIVLAEWPTKPEGDDITGIQSGKNYGNSGFSGGCTQPLGAAT